MRSDLIKIKCKDKAEWLEHQLVRTGGSTASALLGLNEYASAAEVFYKYLGIMPQKQVDSLPMYFGRKLEPVVRNSYQYWEGDIDSMMSNDAAGRIVNEVAYVDDLTILVNPDMPYAHANIDGHIVRNYQGREGILEIKTIASFAAEKYENGFPIGYICQVQLYMAVCEVDYAEIALLKDGRYFEVIPIERNEGIIQTILTKTEEFWRKVNEAKKIMASTDLTQEQKLAMISEYEPEVESSTAYESFLKEKYRNVSEGISPIDGTQEHWELALRHETELKPLKQQTEEEMRLITNTLKRAFEDRDTMSFEQAGNISYKANKNGVRTLRFNLKL